MLGRDLPTTVCKSPERILKFCTLWVYLISFNKFEKLYCSYSYKIYQCKKTRGPKSHTWAQSCRLNKGLKVQPFDVRYIAHPMAFYNYS
jgi:hypothetical protein